MSAAPTFGPFRAAFDGSEHDPTRLVRLERIERDRWLLVGLFDPKELFWIIPALQDAWTRSIPTTRRVASVQ